MLMCLRVVPSCTACTSTPSRGGPASPAAAAAAWSADRARERSPVTAPEPARLNTKIGTVGDRKQVAHRSSPRVTVQL